MDEERASRKHLVAFRSLYCELMNRVIDLDEDRRKEVMCDIGFLWYKGKADEFILGAEEALSVPMNVLNYSFDNLCGMNRVLNDVAGVSERRIGAQ